MDAAKTTLTKTALLLTFVLLFLTPWSAQAAVTITTCGSVILNQVNFGAQCAIQASQANVNFNTSISYAGDTQTNWLQVNPPSGTVGTTNFVLNISLSTGLSNTTHTATITVTGGDSPATISVTYQPTSGGGGSGTIAIDRSSLTFCPTTDCFNPQYVQLTTSSSSAIAFSISAPSWITATQTAGQSGQVSSGNPAQIQLFVNNFSIATSPATVSFNYGTGTVSTSVLITGSGGSGGLTVNPSSVTWSFSTTAGNLPSPTPVSFTDTNGAVLWTAHATSDSNWLLLLYNGGTTTDIYNVPFVSGAGSFSLYPGTNVYSLATGTHTGKVTITDTNNNTQNVNVTLIVNGNSSNNGLSINPSVANLPSVAAGSTNQVSTSISITSTNAGFLSYSSAGNCSGVSGVFNTTAISANQGGLVFTVYGNPTGVPQGTYNTCTLTINLANGSQNIASVAVPVYWVVGSGSGGNNGGPALPTSLSFVAQTGQSATVPPQFVAITGSGNWTASASYTSTQTGWITYTTSGVGPGTAGVSVSPASLSAGSYTGKITYSTPTGNQDVAVSLTVYSNPVIYANQGSLSLQGASGTIIGATSFQVLASDGSHIPFTASTDASWLSLLSATGDTTPSFGSVQVNLANLANGTYVGNVTISAPTAANTTLTVPVVLTVTGSTATGGGSLTFSSSSLAFNAAANGSAPGSQTLTVTAPSGVTYTVSASGSSNNVNWLSISPSGFISATSQNIQVSVNQGSLPVGTYTGFINFSGSSGSQSVQVNLTVSAGGTSSITATPSSLTFAANQNGSAPASQTINLTSTPSSISFNPTTTVANGSTNWISISSSGFTTPASLTVSVNPTGLVAGIYTGTVVVTPTNGSAALNIPVTFNVSGLPTVSASPTSLDLSYAAGGTPPTATLNLTGNAGNAGLNYTTTVTSTCNCIAITPTSGNTAQNPTITVSLSNPTTLTAGTYTGTITVSGTNGSTGTTTVNVSLTVTAPLPTITAIVNAASGSAGPVSPGEIVSIFANSTNPIGPQTPVALSSSNLTSSGNVPTTMGGVTVTFNGRPAALLYVSATQINAVVPYGVAGFNTFPVTVNYLNQNSNGFTVQAVTTAPGIFTQNGQGSGPAAVVNQNGSVNGNTPTTQPAPKGSVIVIYLTGEGQTSPAGVDGKVTCGVTAQGCSSLSQIPVPLLPVAVLIDGQPAAFATAPGWVGYGEAPGFVSGILQINAIVPTTARSGNVSLVVSVGGNTSQSNVTLAVQ